MALIQAILPVIEASLKFAISLTGEGNVQTTMPSEPLPHVQEVPFEDAKQVGAEVVSSAVAHRLVAEKVFVDLVAKFTWDLVNFMST